MEYDFIRKLAVKVSEKEAGALIRLLLLNNIEPYVECDKKEQNYVVVQENGEVSGGNLYVAAADRARAAELLQENGYAAYLCDEETDQTPLDEAERAMQEYYRKRKQNNLITLVIVVIAFLVFFLRGIVG